MVRVQAAATGGPTGGGATVNGVYSTERGIAWSALAFGGVCNKQTPRDLQVKERIRSDTLSRCNYDRKESRCQRPSGTGDERERAGAVRAAVEQRRGDGQHGQGRDHGVHMQAVQ